jgi:hypothetical protein
MRQDVLGPSMNEQVGLPAPGISNALKFHPSLPCQGSAQVRQVWQQGVDLWGCNWAVGHWNHLVTAAHPQAGRAATVQDEA